MSGLNDDIDVYHQTPADKRSYILKLKQKITWHGLYISTIVENWASSYNKHITNQIRGTNSLKALRQKKNSVWKSHSPRHLPVFLRLLCSYKNLKEFSCPVDVFFPGRHNFAFATEQSDMRDSTDGVREELSGCERGGFQISSKKGAARVWNFAIWDLPALIFYYFWEYCSLLE